MVMVELNILEQEVTANMNAIINEIARAVSSFPEAAQAHGQAWSFASRASGVSGVSFGSSAGLLADTRTPSLSLHSLAFASASASSLTAVRHDLLSTPHPIP